MTAELSKHKKLSAEVFVQRTQSYNEIMMEVESTKNLAKAIDEENRRLSKELREVKFRNDLLVQERNIVVQEIIDKKNIIRQLTLERKLLIAERDQLTQERPQTVSRFLGEPHLNSP